MFSGSGPACVVPVQHHAGGSLGKLQKRTRKGLQNATAIKSPIIFDLHFQQSRFCQGQRETTPGFRHRLRSFRRFATRPSSQHSPQSCQACHSQFLQKTRKRKEKRGSRRRNEKKRETTRIQKRFCKVQFLFNGWKERTWKKYEKYLMKSL